MTERRHVRVAPSFFDRLDELLPEERSATGMPSATDFLLHEIPTVIDRLAEDYERHTMVLTAAPELVMIAAGILIPRFSIYTLQGCRWSRRDRLPRAQLRVDTGKSTSGRLLPTLLPSPPLSWGFTESLPLR